MRPGRVGPVRSQAVDVLPGASRRAALAAPHGVPRGGPEVVVAGRLLRALQRVRGHVGLRKIRHGIAARLEEQKRAIAIDDPGSPKAYAHPPPQRLDIQQSLRQRFRHEEPADRSRREGSLLPRQAHCSPPQL